VLASVASAAVQQATESRNKHSAADLSKGAQMDQLVLHMRDLRGDLGERPVGVIHH